MNFRFLLSVILALLFFARGDAQTNVRAWNANGQVFVVWRADTADALLYNVFLSANHVTATSNALKAGSVFEPEWKGSRLTLASPNARWRIPDGSGGTYQLMPNEGLFVYTPHDTFTRYVYVTKDNNSVLSLANRTQQPVFFQYNPLTNPVSCHLQFSGTTGQGFPFSVYAMWADGRNNPNDARPDFPVMANAAKNGAPHVFAVFKPQNNLPAAPYPAVVCLHGGGPSGSYWSYAPNSFHYGNTGNAPSDGLTITFDDRLFLSSNGVLNTDRPTNWFGWHNQLSATNASNAPVNGLAVPYTLRRLVWTIDWLIHSPTYNIDSSRIAIMGNSMGGTGTLLLSRWKPERFSAASAFVPPHYTPETAGRLFGTSQTNMKTTETGPNGDTLRINDFFDAAKPIARNHRDYCLTRIYRGRCDDAAEWGSQHIQLFNDLNEKGLGVQLYWDNRDHTASDWTTDEPGNNCADIGQWVSPVRTERCAVPYQAKFRADQSFPGFTNDDQDFSRAGRQPELGNGSVADGTPWGTWGGYYDWDVNTLKDSLRKWECTIYLVGQSAVSVDNYPGNSATCDITVRKPRFFLPLPATQLYWKLIDLSSGMILQSGFTAPDSAGVVRINGLTVYKDPKRTRLVIGYPGDVENPGSGIVIYPNPATDIVYVKTGSLNIVRFKIINAIGQLVATGNFTDNSVSTRAFPSGVYSLLLFDSAGSIFTSRLIIVRN